MRTMVLRIYGIKECNSDGVPLDWERCRTCEGDGRIMPPGGFLQTDVRDCPTCEGHGSLKAASLVFWTREQRAFTGSDTIRCEDCGHPMSEGIWEVDGEASWRSVDVRCLDWPHDLRPESLAILCLRCYAARQTL